MKRKVNYDYTFKLECVKLVLEKHYSCEYVSKLKGPNSSNIRRWLEFYKNQGKQGFLPRKNQSYNEKIKSNLNKMSPIKYRAHHYQN